MVDILPFFLAILLAAKAFPSVRPSVRPSNTDMMTNTALEAIDRFVERKKILQIGFKTLTRPNFYRLNGEMKWQNLSFRVKEL